MSEVKTNIPWKFLDDYRGKFFSGEWPTLPEMFTISASRFPDRNCFTDFAGPGGTRETLTYAQTLAKIKELSVWLVSHGVKKGDRVSVSGKNSPEWAVVFMAALYAGAIINPVDYALHNEEIENLLGTSEPNILFVDEEKYDYFTSKKFPYAVYSLNRKYTDTYVYNLRDSSDRKNEQTSENDTAAILFTSGTTGHPKGVMLSHKNLVSDCYIAQSRMNIYETDIFYALLPIHHAYTMLAVFIETMSVGAEVVFGKSMAVTKMMKELHDGKITMLLGVPLLYNKLLQGMLKGIRKKGIVVYAVMRWLMHLSYLIKKITGKSVGHTMFAPVLKAANIYTLRIAISGGGPLAPSIFKAYNELGIDFVQGYGLTETSPILTLNPIYHFKVESVGNYFHPWEDMKIVDPDENGVGEICVKGSMVMQGYFKMPEETKKVFTDDGYFKTGDLGWIDGEKYLMLSGRAKNLIVTEGGKNVFPEEIENEFQLYDDIEQITVQGYIDNRETRSESVEALVYPADCAYERIKGIRFNADDDKKVAARIKGYIDAVNKKLQPHARITKITMLQKPLEMTTTRKVKRIYKKS